MTPVLMAVSLIAGIVIGLRINARRTATLRELLHLSEQRHDAWNLSAKRTDLDEIGPATPPRGEVELFDQDALTELRVGAGLDDGLVWCVKHRDGWCAVADGTEPAEGSPTVVTLCGYVVHYPWGYDRRLPDCVECEAFVRDNDAEDEEPEDDYFDHSPGEGSWNAHDPDLPPLRLQTGSPCVWSDNGTLPCGEPAVGTAELTPGEPVLLCDSHYQWACHGVEDDGAESLPRSLPQGWVRD